MSQDVPETILIVDDNAQNLHLLFDALQERYRIVVAQDGPSALTRLAHTSPDLLLLDIMMPGMSGFELYERVRVDFPGLDAPVIFLSALSDTASVTRGFRLSAVDYITKPFRLEEVLARVEKHLSLRRLRRALEAKNVQLEREMAERRRAEAQLRLMEAAVNQANDGVLITRAEPLDPPGPEIVYANPAMERQTGYAPAALRGQTPRIFQGEATDRAALDAIRLALEQRQPIRTELVNYTQAGQPFWVELVIAPVQDGAGRATHFVSIQRDVGERKAREHSLQRAYDSISRKARRLALLNEVAQMMATVVDGGRALEIATGLLNRLFESRSVAILLRDEAGTGLQPVSQFPPTTPPLPARPLAIEGDWLAERVIWDRRPVVSGPARPDRPSPLAATLLSTPGYLLAVSLVARTETTGLLLITRPPDRPFDEEEIELAQTTAGQIAGTVETTRLFEAEQTQRRIAEEALYETGLLYRLGNTLAKAPTTHQAIEAALREYLAALDLPRGRLILFDLDRGLSHVEASLPPTPDPAPPPPVPASPLCRHIIATGQTLNIVDVATDERLTSHQPPFPAPDVRALLLTPLLRRGQVIGLLEGVVLAAPRRFSEPELNLARAIADQTATAVENGRLLEAERQQRGLAEERAQELDAFARTVAHDIKNPLSVIFTYADFLLRYGETPASDKRLDHLRTIHQAARQGTNIVDELLLLAGVRKQTVTPRPVEMGPILDRARARLAHMFEDYGASLRLPDHLPPALGYAPWLEEVWVNYLSNALKYGGDPPRLEVGAEAQADGLVRFWLKDNGPGLPPDIRADLFTEFARLDTLRAQGHGLGLSIVRRIIEKLDGQVGVDSLPGRGCTFFFALPPVPDR